MTINLVGLLILAGDIWAIFNIFESKAEVSTKILWTILVVALPLAGLVIWHFFGPRK